MEKHFTATAYVIKDSKTLLHFHKKLKKWLPPGGHLEENETPVECAKREALEETGLQIEIITQENLWIERPNALSIERPYFCLLENIPAYGQKDAHQHIDMIYLAKPIGGIEHKDMVENGELRWFSLEDLHQLVIEQDIFHDTINAIEHILKAE